MKIDHLVVDEYIYSFSAFKVAIFCEASAFVRFSSLSLLPCSSTLRYRFCLSVASSEEVLKGSAGNASALAFCDSEESSAGAAFFSRSISALAGPFSIFSVSIDSPFSAARVERKDFCFSVAGSPPVAHVFGSSFGQLSDSSCYIERHTWN